jgi:predicted secreted Zn-dependent protease
MVVSGCNLNFTIRHFRAYDMCRLTLFTSFISCSTLLAASAARAEVCEIIETASYTVSGDMYSDVRAQLKSRGPRGFDAHTACTIRWNYRYEQNSASCSTVKATTSLTITYTMPHLETRNEVLRQGFEAYLIKLRQHEDGHAEIGRGIASKIHTAIAALPAAEDCGTLGKTADALANQIILDGNLLDADYDRQTEHGISQGARW